MPRPLPNRRPTETVGVSIARSARLKGRILRVMIRPAPVWVGAWDGVEDPVSRKRPGEGSSSTARRTRSHSSGMRCHSSMTRGLGSVVKRDLMAVSWARSSGSSTAMKVVPWVLAVRVFPTARAPSTLTAGTDCSSSWRRWSMRRGR